MFLYDEYRRIVDDCLRNNRFTKSMTEAERSSVLKKLQFTEPSIELYQYRRCNEFTFYDFLKNQITLVHPKYFNDTFDVLPYINKERLIKTYNSYDIDVSQKMFDITKHRNFTPEEIRELGDEDAAHFFESFSRNTIKQGKEDIFFANFPNMQTLGFMAISSLLGPLCELERNSTRIACFSESYDSPIMWGHYADAGRGFCITYSLPTTYHTIFYPNDNHGKCGETASDMKSGYIEIAGQWLLPVIYCSKRPDFNSLIEKKLIKMILAIQGYKVDLSDLDLLSPLKFTCYKSSDWAYEQEWRWIKTDCSTNTPDFSSISVGRICGLYLGEHISKEHENILKEYASIYKMPDGTNIPVYKMRSDFCNPQYKLTAKRIL